MINPLKITAGIVVTVLFGFAALHTGLARWAFYELFAYVKGVDVLSPTVVREPPVDSPYQRWLEEARKTLPVFEGLFIPDISRVDLRAWPEMGEAVRGLYLRLADYQIIDGRLFEIPAGGQTAPRRQLYEKAVYVVAGSGHTIFRQEGKAPERVDWQEGDLFSAPLNVRHQHFGGSGGPARILVVTSFPLVLNITADEGFATDNMHVFEGRYDGSAGYFAEVPNAGGLGTDTNFVGDVRQTGTQPYDYRGSGSRTMRWRMAGNSMLSMHISEQPARTYMKAHRHSSDAFVLILSGEGYSVTWPEGGYHRRVRVDWKPGTLFVPPTYWYHQHLNTGATVARHLAINTPVLVRNLGLRFADQLEVDKTEVREQFEKALAQ